MERGKWKQIGPTGSWTGIKNVTISGNEIISIDSLGDLWATDIETEKNRYVNNDKYTNSWFLLGTDDEIYTIDNNGTFWITKTSDGKYRQVNAFAYYSQTVNAVLAGKNLITVEKNGFCYITYPDGECKKLNNDVFTNVKFFFSGETMFFIIENNTLYSVNIETGGYKKLSGDGDYANTVIGTGFNDKIITIENTGKMWEIDGNTGEYKKVSDETFLNTKTINGSGNFIYTTEPTGCMYKIAL